jgi:iron complex outermembrane recepter protein
MGKLNVAKTNALTCVIIRHHKRQPCHCRLVDTSNTTTQAMNKPLLAAAIAAARFGLVSLFGASALLAQQPATGAGTTTGTTPKKDEPQKLEKFEVTGSRIKRLDYETTAPVATFSLADIEAKGYTNIGDFIQSLPFNSGFANSIYQTSSFLRGAATTNLRGLGAQRFLTLVNNRRATPYALISPNAGTRQVFDFNSLPAAALESIELLKDGASAIYGSDAITGVLNIKLKKNFSGLSVGAYYGNTLGEGHGGDTGTVELSAVAGAGNAKTKLMTAFDVKTANSNFLRDYGVATTDYSPLGPPKGLNVNSTLNWPANLTLTRAQATAIGLPFPNVAATVGSWSYVIRGGEPNATPTLASFAPAPANPASPNAVLIGNENRYNFSKSFAVYPAYDYISNYTSLEHAFNDTFTAFAEFSYSKNSTYYAFTPAVINYPTEGLTLPATNPYNPFGVALTSLTARTNFGPVRKFDTEAISSNLLGGFRGSLLNRWDWETAVGYGSSNVSTVSRNAIRATVYQAALNGTTRATALNPFGPSDNQSLVDGLFTVSNSNFKADGLQWDGHVSGRIWELPAGDVGMAIGAEARNDKLVGDPDTAAYLGSGGGQPLRGRRTVTSQYAEMTLPLYRSTELGSAEVQVAGRHEHYSDFGDTTKPKYGAKIRLPNNRFVNVVIRGSYSESFKAPRLGLLYASQTVAFSPGVLLDPLRPQDPASQLRIVQGGNPNLLPETAKVKYAGAVFEDAFKIKELSFSFDYFDIRVNQVIVTPGSNFLLSERGRAQFPNAIVRDNSLGNPGPILRLEAVPSNNPAAYQMWRGFDFGIRYTVRNTPAGNFSFAADATQIKKTGDDSGLGGGFFDNAGYYYNPEWKANAGIAWRLKDFGANLNADWTSRWYNDFYGWGENPFTLIHLGVHYAGLWNSTITIGANNLFDNRPPPNGRLTEGFDPGAYGPGVLGRFVYVRVRKDF